MQSFSLIRCAAVELFKTQLIYIRRAEICPRARFDEIKCKVDEIKCKVDEFNCKTDEFNCKVDEIRCKGVYVDDKLYNAVG